MAGGDKRGRTVDVHAVRHTFGTHLSLNGVAPRVAQAATRHSSIQLTMNVYTDPELLDVAGAVEALPCLALEGDRNAGSAVRSGAEARWQGELRLPATYAHVVRSAPSGASHRINPVVRRS